MHQENLNVVLFVVENLEIVKGKTGMLSLSESNTGEELGFVTWSLVESDKKKSLNFEGLTSHVEGKGVGTKLILELINLSKQFGAEGVLSAQASFSPGSRTTRPKTNIPFYYKLGFQATDTDKHNEIETILKRGENIPLRLNVFTDIELSKEASDALEQKAMAQQQAFEKQSTTKPLSAEQMKTAINNFLQNS